MNNSNEVNISNEAQLYVLNVYSPLIKMDILERESSESYSTKLHSLARMPQSYACYSQCYVNDVKFIVWDRDRDRDQKKRTQNSGLMVEDGVLTYYGIIQNIIELHYANGMPIVIFDCTWFNTDPKERDDLKVGDNWKVVNIVSHRGLYSDSSLAREDANEMYSTFLPVEEDDPYQEQMPNDIAPQHYSIAEHIDHEISRARRQLYLDEESDMCEEEDDNGDDDHATCDEDDEMLFEEDDDDDVVQKDHSMQDNYVIEDTTDDD
ncbi:hypothetical protein QQ045_032307 [Rhodiola kirilowii]